jgi:hypothetical protein
VVAEVTVLNAFDPTPPEPARPDGPELCTAQSKAGTASVTSYLELDNVVLWNCGSVSGVVNCKAHAVETSQAFLQCQPKIIIRR